MDISWLIAEARVEAKALKKLDNCYDENGEEHDLTGAANIIENLCDALVKQGFEELSERKTRCIDCAYLLEDESGNWVCDDCQKNVEDIADEDCSANKEF